MLTERGTETVMTDQPIALLIAYSSTWQKYESTQAIHIHSFIREKLNQSPVPTIHSLIVRKKGHRSLLYTQRILFILTAQLSITRKNFPHFQ